VLQAEVTDYIQRPENKDLVRVSVVVESESQRGIMIGKEGTALKKLSTASRQNIEEFLGVPHSVTYLTGTLFSDRCFLWIIAVTSQHQQQGPQYKRHGSMNSSRIHHRRAGYVTCMLHVSAPITTEYQDSVPPCQFHGKYRRNRYISHLCCRQTYLLGHFNQSE
jgi:hypothetical protein